jgi:tRNA (cmo5U34)-methyltransferase
MTIDNAFNKSAEYYDDWIKKALPSCDELFAAAVDSIPFGATDPIKVLDLGAGTGLFSWYILQKFHQADFTLLDIADKLLEIAKERFASHPQQFQTIIQDYKNLELSTKFDLIISSLSIHHLQDEEKKQLFKKVYSHLKPHGVFINVDQIKGPTDVFQTLYWSNWLDKVRQADATEEQIQESIQRRTEFDKDATLLDQLSWLHSAGFNQVDCLYKNFFVGVFFART